MRFKLYFELENNTIPMQYRKSILSFIKHALQEYDENLYQELYHKKDNIKKTYSFAPILPHAQFNKTEQIITLSQNCIQIIFSIYNYAYALHIYNAILAQKKKPYPLNQNSMNLTKVSLIYERKIETDHIQVKMLSPIICRNHDQITKKDMYYSFERPEFETFIRINILEQMKAEGLDSSLMEGFEIKPIQAKKTVIPVYEKMLECSLGTFEMTGKQALLNYLYRAGIGSKKAMGFGLCEII